MPDTLFVHKASVLNTIMFVFQKDRDYFQESLVNRYCVNNIPLKVDVKKYPEIRQIMDNPANSFSTVYPSDMLNENIGSSLGLVSIIRNLYIERGMIDDTCSDYLTVNVDENIYYRILKVSI